MALIDEAQGFRESLLASDSVTVGLKALTAASAKMATLIGGGGYAGLTTVHRHTADLIVSALRQIARLGSYVVLGAPPPTVATHAVRLGYCACAWTIGKATIFIGGVFLNVFALHVPR